MRWSRRGVVGVLMAASAERAPAAQPPGPAIWEVRGPGGARVLIFGDNPAQRAPWRSARIEAAVRASRVFWKETPASGPDAWKLFVAKGVDAARPLSSWLTPSQRARVASAAATVGFRGALERYRPWLAAVLLEDRFNASAGFKAEDAPAHHLTAVAEAAGIPIHSEFPDIAAVVDYFADFSPAAEVGSLMRTVDDIEAGPEAAEREARAWAAGDLGPERAWVLRVRAAYPEYYRRILAERNRRWAVRIHDMLRRAETSFILVGDAHLAGPDSVQRELARSGLTTRRA